MDWLQLLYDICKVCLIPLLGVLTTYVIKFINSKEVEVNNKIENDIANKYISMVAETVRDCVRATTQTYVDSLKATGSFDDEAQKEAFKKSYKAVVGLLTDDVKAYIAEAYGDITTYLTSKIEAEVKIQKIYG